MEQSILIFFTCFLPFKMFSQKQTKIKLIDFEISKIIELENLMDWKNNEPRLKTIHVSKPYFACYIGDSNYNDFAEEIENVK